MAEFTEDEPKLTVKLRSEITEPDPAEFTPIRPAEPIVEPEEPTIESEDEEERFEETMESTVTSEDQGHESGRQQTRKSKVTKKTPAKKEPKGKSTSQFQSELRKHSDAIKKADLTILDIRKELKDLLLIHHATIKDLQKQVAQMHRKIATIDSSKKSIKSKTTGKKTGGIKKTSGSKKPTKKSTAARKNNRKR